METNEIYANVATELIEIFKYMEKSLKDKIPVELEENLKMQANKEHEFHIDKTKTLKEQNMLPETKKILAGIYIKYLHPEEENEIMEIWKQNEIKQQQKNREMYNPDNLFKKKKEIVTETSIENNQLIKIEDVWYKKVIMKIQNVIKRLFGK